MIDQLIPRLLSFMGYYCNTQKQEVHLLVVFTVQIKVAIIPFKKCDVLQLSFKNVRVCEKLIFPCSNIFRTSSSCGVNYEKNTGYSHIKTPLYLANIL